VRNRLIIIVILLQTIGFPAFAQENNKSTPAVTNIAGVEYPRILPDLKVEFRFKTPNAQKVQIDLGKMYDMIRDERWVVDNRSMPVWAI